MFDVNCGICKKFITSETEEESCPGSIITVATMIDDRKFSYGISGVFQFKSDLGVKADDEICNECLKLQKDNFEPVLTVPCSICGKLHQPVFEGNLERDGWHCNSDVNLGETRKGITTDNGKLYVTCGWGSKYDTDYYEVTKPVVKDGDQICDECITKFIADGAFVDVSSASDKDGATFSL